MELGVGSGLAACAVTAKARPTRSANARVVVGVMGVHGRGMALAQGFASRPNVEVAYLCDVDTRAVEAALAALKTVQQTPAQGIDDFRRILEDPHVDALVIATPNHWHAPATILACAARKHVYVEKPCSYSAQEGEWAVAAARKHNRVVTMGTQRRSWPGIVQAIDRLRHGDIGTVRYARTWYNNRRPAIGRGRQVDPPAWLNYELWQGPAARRPFKDNLVHYNWHWHWHWGNGELGNNGVHAVDLARWGMQVDFPTRVSSSGGRYRFDDDQETPDTQLVAFEFDKRVILWEAVSWSPMGPGGSSFGVTFHGDEGTLTIKDGGYEIHDSHLKQVASFSGTAGDAEHLDDFLACVRDGKHPSADIEEAHKSTLMCHLGNISQQVGRALRINPQDGHIIDDADAASRWGREYAPGWEPKV
ncbi:MAG: Gfo/Idh/MocA family oxidoreductase [Planctomycetes bacterium]|nr:Gfo/Idh/MocA family oxidoreductase [Planctomycetota bacterium]